MSNEINRRGFVGLTAGLAAVTAVPVSLVGAPTAAAAGNGAAVNAAFAHPGILHSQDDLDRMRSAVAAQSDPIWSGFGALAADPRSAYDYAVRNTGQITTWGRGPYNYQNEAPADAAAAYQNALMWYLTQDVRHADKARDILDVWARTLTGITGADGQLGATLQGFKLANAAELLRHSNYQGWDDEAFRRCQESLRGVWYRAQSGYALFANGNWDSVFRTTAAIAVLCDDRVMFEDAMRYAAHGAGNGSVTHRIVNTAGQGQESGRDQTHEQLALAMLADAAQVAWNQGVDLYGFAGNRILASYEYDAKYNLGNNDVPFTPDLDRTGKYIRTVISTLVRGVNRPMFELAYGHYVSRLGLTAPFTEQAVFRGTGGARFVEGYNEDHPGFGTLTYARPAAAQTTPTTAPGVPTGLAATNQGSGVRLSWIGSVEPITATVAATYTVYRAKDNGTFGVLATGLTTTSYTDLSVKVGGTYHYAVSATNAAGTSQRSFSASSTAGLPGLWRARDVGGLRGGATTFDGERFLLDDGGTDIGGTSDSFRFASVPLRGDGVITARIVHPVSSQYAKIGVMFRSTLDGGSPHAAMLLQGLPLSSWSGVWTTRAAAGGPTTATGSTPVSPAQQQAITTDAGYPISNIGVLPSSATPLRAPYVEAAGDGYRLRMPYWVRLERKNNRFTGSMSPDGVTWTVVGSTELDLGQSLYVGLALCSCLGVRESYAETGSGAFDNVTVTGVWTVPPPVETVTDLSAVAGSNAVELAWSCPDLAARYTVLRSAGGAFQVIATDVAPIGFGVRTTYTDSTGVPGTAYRYAVAKTNVSGRGPLSAAATATMPSPARPEITNPAEAFATVGQPFVFRIQGTNEPTSYAASGLPDGLVANATTGAITGTPRAAGRSTIILSAANAAGPTTTPLDLTVGGQLPSGWSAADIGDYVPDERRLGTYSVVALRRPGNTAYDTGAFTVRGAGTDLNVNGQGMTAHYAYTQVEGDATFVARISSRDNAGDADQVGLLMLKSLSPFDQMAGAFLVGNDSGTKQFIRRLRVAAGTSTSTGSGGAPVPTWLKLERSGSRFTAFSSADGQTWALLGRDAIPAFGNAPYYVGLSVTSRVPLELNTSVFDNITITPGADSIFDHPVSDPYRTFSSALATTAEYGQSGTDLAIRGAGADAWSTVDQYSTIYRPGAVQDGATVTVAVTYQDAVDSWTKSGIIIRNDLTGAGKAAGYLFLAVTPKNGVALQWDGNGDGGVDSNKQTGGTPVFATWLRLTRSGTTFTGSYSTDGKTWTAVGSANVPSAAAVQDAGVFTTSHSASGAAGEADFSDFTIS
ncbi:alginate lyase family protein [Kribbella sp. NPDC004536]|uniref:alginate lyase family protein n=1 Tax=Kribbella sp. NPDC004536 TaxID=3364106 RepID=UPI0036AC4AA8